MANQFGALTDHFNLATSDLVLVDSSLTPVAKSIERATDEDGDNVAEQEHGQTAAGTLAEASCTYALKSGTLDTSTLACGYFAAAAGPPAVLNRIITSISIATSNDGWPQVTVTGMVGVIAVTAVSGKDATYTLPEYTITGYKRAQLIGFTIGENGRLTSSSYEATIETASQADGEGVIVAHGMSGGVQSVTAEQVAIDAAATWTPAAGWIETQAPGVSEGQASWHTASMSAEQILERDTSA
jgi:hypothetical protein